MIWCPSKVDVHGCKIQNKLNWSSPCNQAYMFPLKICGRLWFDCLLPTVKSDNESNPKARESFRCLKHTKINVLLVALPDFSKPFLAERNGIGQRFLYARKSNALLSVSSFEQETKLFVDVMKRDYCSKDTNSIKEWNAPRRSLQNCRINAIKPRKRRLVFRSPSKLLLMIWLQSHILKATDDNCILH